MRVKRIMALFLALSMLVSWFPFETRATQISELETLITQLPEVSDPLGTEYYFYNQLADFEKVVYWKIAEATWDNPIIAISGVTDFTEEQLQFMCQRALSALIADDPEYHMYWERYAQGSLTGNTYSFELRRYEIASEYLIRKATARIDQIVATIGQEGDIYSRIRELLELLARETDYEYSIGLIGDSNITRKTQFNDCILGLFTNNYAVCGGYADSVKVLCDQLNIPCIVVGNAGHAWNFVQMEDGQWYSVDATADCPFETYENECNLIGSDSVNYATNYIYHLSDLYIGTADDFVFPELSKNEYHYDKDYMVELHEVTNAFDEGTPKFVYKVNDDQTTCTIITYEGPQTGDLIIPSSIDGYVVTAIGESAFFAMDFNGDLVIADSVNTIGAGAFQNCEKLVGELTLPAQVVEIQKMAFLECSGLTGSINLPSSLRIIGAYSFAYCDSFNGDLVFPEGIELGNAAFSYCSGLDGTIYLPDNLVWDAHQLVGTNLHEIVANSSNPNYSTFDGILYSKDLRVLIACPGGKTGSIVIPEGVEIISESAFRECRKINGTLTLPSTLKEIGANAFLLTGGFTGDLIIPDSVSSIGSNAFGNAGFDGILKLPESLTAIEGYTFSSCSFTGDLTIPDSVQHIGEYAFLYCPFGGALILPAGLGIIGQGAFSAGSSAGAFFSNALDLSASNVQIAEDAFWYRIFPEFSCNCNVAFEIDSWGESYTLCTKCGGGEYYGYISGWNQIDGAWYYYQDGAPVTGWLKSGNYWYYLNTDGAMTTGWVKVGSNWFYMNKSGVMQTGWQQINGKWYYFASGGAMQTGWLKDGSYWYYLDSTGAMTTGWVKVGSNWFYMNKSGVMQTGWQKINGYWYYFASGGAMQTGWVNIGGKWYYFASGGAMQTGWQQINGKWYYFASGGAMQTGWLYLNGYWYYLDAKGVMVTGTQVINGKTYVFNKSGAWIG